MRTISACSIVVSLMLAACGDDSAVPDGTGGGTTSTSTSTATATSTATSTSTSTSTGTGGEGGSGEGGSGEGGSGEGGSGEGGSGEGGSGEGGSGEGGSGEGGSGEGGAPPADPIACAVCVATECPEIAECIQDPACADGMVCTLTTCIVDGEPDLGCIAECFDGDFGAALGALEALGCIVTTCGDDCGGLVPGT